MSGMYCATWSALVSDTGRDGFPDMSSKAATPSEIKVVEMLDANGLSCFKVLRSCAESTRDTTGEYT